MLALPAIFGGLGFAELLVVTFIAVLVFGGRLPEVMRNLGRTYARFRQGLHDVSRPIRQELSEALAPPHVHPPAPDVELTPPSVPYEEGPAAPAGPFPAATPPRPAPTAPATPADWDEPPPV